VTPDDPYTFIYTSGTTGPPKGCVLSHGNYRAILDSVAERGLLTGEDDLTYLFLPLAHAFALLIQLSSFDLGAPIAYFGGDPKAIIPELSQVKPTYLPSVPRIFEKLFTMAQGNLQPEQIEGVRKIGGQVKDLEVAGKPIPEDLQKPPTTSSTRSSSRTSARRSAGGCARRSRARADRQGDPRVLLGRRRAGARGLRHDRDGDRGDDVDARGAQVRHGRPALPGVEIKIAEDGEILIKGGNIFAGYHNNADASFGAVEDGWLHTGDLGALDDEGYLSITGARRTSSSPRAARTSRPRTSRTT
jgi:long-chain acyl-CoA synthetase